jgi:hypothetical protein
MNATINIIYAYIMFIVIFFVRRTHKGINEYIS